MEIVDTLERMNEKIAHFSGDIEKKLESVYKSGVGKKYGYNNMTQQAKSTVFLDDGEEKMNRAVNNANNFLKSAQIAPSTRSY